MQRQEVALGDILKHGAIKANICAKQIMRLCPTLACLPRRQDDQHVSYRAQQAHGMPIAQLQG